jgi:hypothetical protein
MCSPLPFPRSGRGGIYEQAVVKPQQLIFSTDPCLLSPSRSEGVLVEFESARAQPSRFPGGGASWALPYNPTTGKREGGVRSCASACTI